MALALVCLLLHWIAHIVYMAPVSVGMLLLTMTWPVAFKPLAVIWFGLSKLMGALMSCVVFTLVFFLVLTPVGLLRRLLGRDPLALRRFKKDVATAFAIRETHFTSKDLEKPF